MPPLRLHLWEDSPLSPCPEDAPRPVGGTGNGFMFSSFSALFFHGFCSSSTLFFFPPLPSTLQPHPHPGPGLCSSSRSPGFQESRASWVHSYGKWANAFSTGCASLGIWCGKLLPFLPLFLSALSLPLAFLLP